MTKKEIEEFRFGYHECRAVILGKLKKIIRADKIENIGDALTRLVAELEADIEREHWGAIQQEFPGVTRDEYEAECADSEQQIRKTRYSEHGYLRPRLVPDPSSNGPGSMPE